MSSHTVREVVLDLFRSFGITTIFGNPGSTELPMFRDFPADFRYVLGLQELVVVGMADGYAQASRNAGLVNLHSATGVGHGLGSVFTAYKNQTPLVITAGQQARSILPFEPFLFAERAPEFPRPYVKWSCEPARAEDVPAAIARAYYTAMQPPRGPTFVSIPVDDWDRFCEPLAPRPVSAVVRGDLSVAAEDCGGIERRRSPGLCRRCLGGARRCLGRGNRACRTASGEGLGQPEFGPQQLSGKPPAFCRASSPQTARRSWRASKDTI